MDEGMWEPLGWSACPVGCPRQGCFFIRLFGNFNVYVY